MATNSTVRASLLFLILLSACGNRIDESSKPLALIYKGPGACSADQHDAGTSGYGCAEAAADSAHVAGYQTKFVGPQDLPENATAAQTEALFGKAKIWVQPGGVADTAYYAMTTSMRAAIVNFVKNGGGYVGFCAGAFLAANWFSILPASAILYGYTPIRTDLTYAFLPVTWQGYSRSFYFEGGPYFTNIASSVENVARFSDGNAASLRSTFGKGKIWVSGPHPEAPAVWSTEDGFNDSDGSEIPIAAEMMTWVAP